MLPSCKYTSKSIYTLTFSSTQTLLRGRVFSVPRPMTVKIQVSFSFERFSRLMLHIRAASPLLQLTFPTSELQQFSTT